MTKKMPKKMTKKMQLNKFKKKEPLIYESYN